MSEKYDNYLKEHIANVEKGYKWMREHLPKEIFSGISMMELDDNIARHDLSKYGSDEYEAYDNYFYGTRTYAAQEAFNKAWLHHIHNNPHHWQYWLLHEDDPKDDPTEAIIRGQGDNVNYICIEMPKQYVIEMVADWWTFSWKSKNLYEIFNWYNQHILIIKLNSATRDYLDRVLLELKKAIDKEVMGYVEACEE